jgi:hypothetical protein
MGLVLDAFLFFELSGDEVVDPDTAVQQMEWIMSELRKLPKPDRELFARFVEQAVKDEEKHGHRSERIKAMQTILEDLTSHRPP